MKYKLTWLALAEDHAALSRSLEQLMALPRPVKVKRVLLVSLAAKFLAEAVGVRATATKTQINKRQGLHSRASYPAWKTQTLFVDCTRTGSLL